MIEEASSDETRVRWEAVQDLAAEVVIGSDGHPTVVVGRPGSQVELRIMRDTDPAADSDILFVGHSFSDVPHLLDVLESGGQLSVEDAARIEARLASASPGPWTAFIETEGGIGGVRCHPRQRQRR